MYTYVDSASQLPALIEAVRGAESVAADTEADSLHHYFEKVCLLQLAVDDGAYYLVDPLAGLELRPLLDALAEKPLIFHGADYDVRMLKQSFAMRPRAEIFDTMLAAQLLGQKQIGLAALVEHYFGVTLSKAGQKSDWSRRPLPENLLEYAALDVRHLHEIVRLQSAELEALGRTGWHTESCLQMARCAVRATRRDPDLAWRIKGSHKLEGRRLALLNKVWRWRDREARTIDRIAAAERSPASTAASASRRERRRTVAWAR